MPERTEVSICWATKKPAAISLICPSITFSVLLSQFFYTISSIISLKQLLRFFWCFRYFVWKYFCYATEKSVGKGANWRQTNGINDGWEGWWERTKWGLSSQPISCRNFLIYCFCVYKILATSFIRKADELHLSAQSFPMYIKRCWSIGVSRTNKKIVTFRQSSVLSVDTKSIKRQNVKPTATLDIFEASQTI